MKGEQKKSGREAKPKIEKVGSRRVKSLGSEKVDEKVMREIKKELRERPQ